MSIPFLNFVKFIEYYAFTAHNIIKLYTYLQVYCIKYPLYVNYTHINMKEVYYMKIKNIISEAAVLTGLLVSVFMQGAVHCAAAKEQIRDDVFRLHIIANSDSEDDVSLK